MIGWCLGAWMSAFAAPQVYDLQPSSSWLYVVVYGDRERFTPVPVHDHVVRASTFQGKVTWDPEDPAACDIAISFPITALTVDPDGARQREQLSEDGAIDEDTKETVVNNLRSNGNLYADQFPQISYRSTSCATGAGGSVVVTGDLTIRGVGKSIAVPMTITSDAASFRARGTFELTHADFGMKPFTYGPLTPKNLERLKFVVDVRGAGQYVPPAPTVTDGEPAP